MDLVMMGKKMENVVYHLGFRVQCQRDFASRLKMCITESQIYVPSPLRVSELGVRI